MFGVALSLPLTRVLPQLKATLLRQAIQIRQIDESYNAVHIATTQFADIIMFVLLVQFLFF